MRDLDLVPVVAVGGAIGAAARFGMDVLVPHGDLSTWPWSTFLINVVGSFVLGLVLIALLRTADGATVWGRWARPFLVTGVLGGFTTFSAYALQVRDLVAGGAAGTAVVYAVASVALGVCAVALGLAAGARVWPPDHRLTTSDVGEA